MQKKNSQRKRRQDSAWALIGKPSELSDIRYVSGFAGHDDIVCVGQRGKIHLVVPEMETGRAKKLNVKPQIWSPGILGLNAQQQRDSSVWLLFLLKRLNCFCVQVNPAFPLKAARLLEENNISVIHNETTSIFAARAIKSENELRFLIRAQKAAAAAMRVAVDCIKNTEIDAGGGLLHHGKRLTSEMLRKLIRIKLAEYNCEAAEVIAACGAGSADPHEKGRGIIRAGKPIVLDIFPRHVDSGYWGDMTRTVCRGKAPAELTAMWRAVQLAHKKALEQIRPGVNARTVYNTAVDCLNKAGFTTSFMATPPQGFIHGLGHGVGLDIHEEPVLGKRSYRLKKGMVITVEPGLYYPRLGGIRIEDTVAVTENGARILAGYPYLWEL